MTEDGKSLYFVFSNTPLRDKVYNLMRESAPDCTSEDAISKLTAKWQAREISNY